MYTKEMTMWFSYCDAKIQIYFDGEEDFILTLTELIEDEEKTTRDITVMKGGSTTEITLGVDEMKELIRTLQSLLPNKEEKE